MNRYIILACMFFLCPGLISSLQAQRIVVIHDPGGSSEDTVFVAQLPPETHAYLRKELGCVPNVAFYYKHSYLFFMDIWHSDGKFVLSHQKTYWNIPREELITLLGPGGEALLKTPWWYGYPFGLFFFGVIGLVVAGLIALFVVLMIVQPIEAAQERKIRALAEDDRYVEAMQEYLAPLPASGIPSLEQHEAGLKAGVEHLATHGVGAGRARKTLAALLKLTATDRMADLKEQASQCIDAGEWHEALQHYQDAIVVIHHWDSKQVKLIEGTMEWCQKEMVQGFTTREPIIPPGKQAELN